MGDEGAVAQGVDKEVCVLLVEDDTRLAGLLQRGFRAEGYAVDFAGLKR